MIRAALFDLDGTMGDTLAMCIEAFRRTIFHFDGRTLKDEDISCFFGPSDRGVINRLLPDDETLRARAYDMFLEYYRELHPVMTPAPFPGIHDLLDMLRQRGIRLGVVTGKAPETAAITLQQFGLAPYFGEYVETGSPDGVVKDQKMARLLKLFGIAPCEAVYVGDVAADVRSSRLAGVTPLSAAWASTADSIALQQAHPERIFATVAELHAYLDEMTKANSCFLSR